MKARGKAEIVKVQVPIIGGEPGCCLVYDKQRHHMLEQTVPHSVRAALGTDLKGYFRAQWLEPHQRWDITPTRAGEQPW